MRTRFVFVIILVTSLLGFANTTDPCGTFSCQGEGIPKYQGAQESVQFTFTPTDCTEQCSCDQIVYIQIVRMTRGGGKGDIFIPEAEPDYVTRMVTGQSDENLNGWWIDNWANAAWGYYARNDDGEFDTWMEPGSNTKAATLQDQPGQWGNDLLYEFVDVTVCIDEQAKCKNKLLGFKQWWFIVGKADFPPPIDGPHDDTVPKEYKKAVDLAVNRWNELAGEVNSNRHSFPKLSRMSSGD